MWQRCTYMKGPTLQNWFIYCIATAWEALPGVVEWYWEDSESNACFRSYRPVLPNCPRFAPGRGIQVLL